MSNQQPPSVNGLFAFIGLLVALVLLGSYALEPAIDSRTGTPPDGYIAPTEAPVAE